MRYSRALVAVLVLACFARAGAEQKPRTARDQHLYQLARTDLKALQSRSLKARALS